MKKTPYRIDERTEDELRKQIAELAASYTPEWIFDTENPDIGSVLAILFANQMNGSIDRFNHIIDKYRVELVNLLNVGIRPAYPADGICVLNTIQEAVPGVDVPAGIKLIGTGDGDSDSLIFETAEPIHVTSANITDILQVSGSTGRIIPLRSLSEEEEVDTDEIRLFDFSKKGIEQNALMLYHENVFDVPADTDIVIEVFGPDGKSPAELLAKPEDYLISYYDGSKFVRYSEVHTEDGALVLRSDGGSRKVELPDGRLANVVRIDAQKPVTEVLEIANIKIHSMAASGKPDFASNNENDLGVDSFMPFGNTASIFDDCYIGSDSVFAHDGADVTLKFKLSFREKLVTFTPEQVDASLKVIKRKAKKILYTTANTKVDRIAVEYFNGTGWRRLATEEQWTTVFNGETDGEIELSFTCPPSWEPVTIGAHTGRCLRLRIESADNCYLQPCVHKMPFVEDFSISYRYDDGDKKSPSYIRTIVGTEPRDFTSGALQGGVITAFSPLPNTFNSLYLGFDRKIEGRPISLYFELKYKLRGYGIPLSLEYSTSRGFKHLRVTDETEGLSMSGIIMMEPGEDIAPLDVYGKKRFWIRIKDQDSLFTGTERVHPIITNILPNAVPVRNERTLDEDSYFIDESAPFMTFSLPANNILSAEVFVNESNMPKLSMQRMIEQRPQDVRVVRGSRGDISEFYVRWEEAPNFDASKAGDRHYVIDRLNSVIRFGDGIGARIPEASSDPAFTVRLKCCDGAAGNLPIGAINGLMDRILYIGDAWNPLATSGGSNMESVANATRRGSDLLNSTGRLMSEADYIREAENYSDMIAEASCIIGDKGRVDIALLTRDYAEGAWSFDQIRSGLRSTILSKCEATLTAEQINIVEPTYVKIDIDVWAAIFDPKQRFETAALIEQKIRERIEPLPAASGIAEERGGWKIGDVPEVNQIDIMLHGISQDVVIKHWTATATYVDLTGAHSVELSRLERLPLMLGVNGVHHVHFI